MSVARACRSAHHGKVPLLHVELAAYTNGLARMIRARLDYYTSPRTHRCTNPDGVSPDAVSAPVVITEKQPANTGRPVDLPAIRW